MSAHGGRTTVISDGVPDDAPDETSADPGAGKSAAIPVVHDLGSRLALRNWRLRSKQIVVVVTPIVAALVLGFLRISSELGNAEEFSRTVTQVDLSAAVSKVIHDVQAERDLVVGQLASPGPGDSGPVAEQTRRVDDSVSELERAAGSIADLDDGVVELYARVTGGLDTLDAVRAFATESRYPASDVLWVYERLVAALLQLDREITRVSDERVISQQANTVDALARAKEQVAIQNSILRAGALADVFGPGQLSRLRSAEAKFTAAMTDFEASADPTARARYTSTVAGPEIDQRLRLQQVAQNRAEANTPIDLDISQIDTAATGTLEKMRQVEIATLNELRSTAHDLLSNARHNAIRDAALIGAAVVLALLLMLAVTSSLVHPLRVLRTSALEVAHHRLPATVHRILADRNPVEASKQAVDPVPIFTREETGEVARAFDAVHDQAIRMATEQALLRDNINAIFVNLSRRSQALVERLLAVIDRLEREELDPDQLANLFEVDHLATRMRRNSESLLVLSGSGLSRRLTQPVPATEVIDAAISEVEHYTRITVEITADDVAVHARVVSDLVHLIAELLDNATAFSDPGTKVAVRVITTRYYELAIQITDQGVGMSDEDIAAANARLADPPILDVGVTRRMGLYVVARLAVQHSIRVRLRHNEDIEGGLIANIIVPSDLVLPAHPPEPTAPNSTLPPADPTTTTGRFAGAVTAAVPRRRGPATLERAATTADQAPQPRSPDTPGHPRHASHTHDTGHGALPPAEPTVDPPTERLPIYEAVLSQWFNDTTETSPPPHTVPTSTPDTTEDTTGDSLTESPTGSRSAHLPSADKRSWVSPGDEGWHAAQALLDNRDNDTTTAAGLPKRVPKSRLLPGSAGPAPQPEHRHQTVAPPVPPRSADLVRYRMASFQQGVRRGRHAFIDTYTTDTSVTDTSVADTTNTAKQPGSGQHHRPEGGE